MYKINLNCDLGEGAPFDGLIIPQINSANIACGFHAGDSMIIRRTIDLCRNYEVDIGVHPGYPDRENFGRTDMEVSPQQVYDFTIYQLGALGAMAGGRKKLTHVKPHGAMYNQAAKNRLLANAIVNAVYDYNKELILLALANSQMISAARDRGLRYASEVFADRAYEADGSLRPRKLEGAIITDENEVIERVIKMIKLGKVTAYTGEETDIEAHSVCVHGDGEKALLFVKKLREAFVNNNIETVRLTEAIG